MRTTDVLRSLTPPIVVRGVRHFRRDRQTAVAWEHVPEGWAYADSHPETRGWNVQEVLAAYVSKWPQYVAMVQGTGPLGVAHESALTTREDVRSQNAVMAFGYSLALTAGGSRNLSMLDWGGGIGHFYLLARALLPQVDIEYHCKDVPLLSEYGATLFPEQHFCSDERCLDMVYDFVFAGASMHYTERWEVLLRRFGAATGRYLYVADLPTVLDAPSFVFVQRAYEYGYNTEYLSWCLNRTEFLRVAADSGLQLEREFVYGRQPRIQGAPEQNAYRGYLFRRPDATTK